MLPTRRFIPSNPTKLCKNLISFNQKRTQFNCQTSLREHYCHNEELISNFPSIKLLHESSAFTAGLNLDKNEHGIALAHNPSNSHYLQLLEKMQNNMLWDLSPHDYTLYSCAFEPNDFHAYFAFDSTNNETVGALFSGFFQTNSSFNGQQIADEQNASSTDSVNLIAATREIHNTGVVFVLPSYRGCGVARLLGQRALEDVTRRNPNALLFGHAGAEISQWYKKAFGMDKFTPWKLMTFKFDLSDVNPTRLPNVSTSCRVHDWKEVPLQSIQAYCNTVLPSVQRERFIATMLNYPRSITLVATRGLSKEETCGICQVRIIDGFGLSVRIFYADSSIIANNLLRTALSSAMEIMGDWSKINQSAGIKGNQLKNESTKNGRLIFSIHSVSTNSAAQKLIKRLTNDAAPIQMDIDHPQATSFQGIEFPNINNIYSISDAHIGIV